MADSKWGIHCAMALVVGVLCLSIMASDALPGYDEPYDHNYQGYGQHFQDHVPTNPYHYAQQHEAYGGNYPGYAQTQHAGTAHPQANVPVGIPGAPPVTNPNAITGQNLGIGTQMAAVSIQLQSLLAQLRNQDELDRYKTYFIQLPMRFKQNPNMLKQNPKALDVYLQLFQTYPGLREQYYALFQQVPGLLQQVSDLFRQYPKLKSTNAVLGAMYANLKMIYPNMF